MPDAALDTLWYALDENSEILADNSSVLFLRAKFHPLLLQQNKIEFVCQQTFRPEAFILERHGFSVNQPFDHQDFDACLYLATKHNEENLFNFARGIKSLRTGGVFVCSASNRIGAGRYEKYLAEIFTQIDSLSKNKCRVFWGRKTTQTDQRILDQWFDKGAPARLKGTSLICPPGVFSWQKIDRGSRFLTDNLPKQISGVVADLGCGYGYLSHYLLTNYKDISELHLYEAEALALNAARSNLKEFDLKTRYFWHDVTAGLTEKGYDQIVMNPPFHQGKAAAAESGIQFIQAAAKALKRKGILTMVSNSHLPYSNELAANFRKVSLVTDCEGFRVYQAIK